MKTSWVATAICLTVLITLIYTDRPGHQVQALTPDATEQVGMPSVDELPPDRQPIFESHKPVAIEEHAPTISDILFEDYRGQKATPETFARFCQLRGCVNSEENFEIFSRVVDIDTLQNYILGYRIREIEKFENREQGRDLATELEPIINYIHDLVIDEFEFWVAVDEYTDEVIHDATNAIDRGVGESYNERRITDLLYEKKLELLKGLK